MNQEKNIEQNFNNLKTWFKRIGFIGFMFFLVKGLIWLTLFIGIGEWFK